MKTDVVLITTILAPVLSLMYIGFQILKSEIQAFRGEIQSFRSEVRSDIQRLDTRIDRLDTRIDQILFSKIQGGDEL